MLHLEQTLKIEEEEMKLKEKLDFHKSNAAEEAKLKAKKSQEMAAEQVLLEQEEGERRILVKKMTNNSNSDLSPIKNVLQNFEGTGNRSIF